MTDESVRAQGAVWDAADEVVALLAGPCGNLLDEQRAAIERLGAAMAALDALGPDLDGID
jgi:hypothetical protein